MLCASLISANLAVARSSHSVTTGAYFPQSIPPTPLFYEVMQMIFCELELERSLSSELLPALSQLVDGRCWLCIDSLGPGGEGGHPYL